MEVTVRKNNVSRAMNLLNKKLREDGDFRRVKERRYYKPPSVKRQEAKKAARKSFKKDLVDRMGGDEIVLDRRPAKRKSKKEAWEQRVQNDQPKPKIPRAKNPLLG